MKAQNKLESSTVLEKVEHYTFSFPVTKYWKDQNRGLTADSKFLNDHFCLCMKINCKEDEYRSKETNQKAIAIFEARDDDGLDQGRSS